MKRFLYLLATMMVLCSQGLYADSITLSGTVSQPNFNPPASNSGLDNIQIGDSYTVTLNFAGAINAAGNYTLDSATFSDAAAGASENGFNSGSISLFSNGDFSVQACLTGCNVGNELDLNFNILFADLNSQGVSANGVPNLLALDLLEDGGLTDIQASVDTYYYNTAASPVPEPASLLLLGSGLMGIVSKRFRR